MNRCPNVSKLYKFFGFLENSAPIKNVRIGIIKKSANCLQLEPFGCGDLDWTNFNKIYGGFEEIGLLEVKAVFHWLYEFGLDVLLGIDRKKSLISKND